MSTSSPTPAPTFASVRIVTDDVPRMVAFYEQVTGITATWGTELFAEIVTSGGTLAIAGTPTLALFGDDIAQAAANRTVILELQVFDVDADSVRLEDHVDFVQAPTTMPWGNRSLLFRDPDGNLINLYTPVTAEALERFQGR
jgi:catechol 2,3-dioxygenase-like lactoylglutathione lyase family enzyme